MKKTQKTHLLGEDWQIPLEHPDDDDDGDDDGDGDDDDDDDDPTL